LQNGEDMKLTKKCEKTLMGWHAGSGHVFVSDGSGTGLVRTDIGFVKKGDAFSLWIGNRKAIKLTPEQIKVIGDFFMEPRDED
jgi:hypothetical protein